jgi:hypothetical protein
MLGLALILSAPIIQAQASRDQNADGQPKYKLLATTKTSTMLKEIQDSAKQGYRIVVGSPTSGAEMAILMEKVAEVANPYQYKLLATTRTGTMQKELNEAADQGYRLLPRTMIAKAQLIGGVEIVVILERLPTPDMKYNYKLLATSLTSTLQKEMLEAQAAGYVIAGMVSRDEHMVIMERAASIPR